MSQREWCMAHLSEEAWELVEKLYDLARVDETPDFLGGSESWWVWLRKKIERAQKDASKDPRRARRFASWDAETLKNYPNIATRLVEIEPEKKRHNQNSFTAPRYKRVKADTRKSVKLELSYRILIDEAEAEERRLGIDSDGQALVFPDDNEGAA